MSIPFIFNGSRLSIVINGKQHTLDATDRRFNSVITAVKENRDEDFIENLFSEKPSLDKYINEQNNVRVTVSGENVYVDGKLLENAITKRVVEFMRFGLPIEHLLKFIERLENNPSYNSRQQAYGFLEHMCLVITEDGYILGYKSVRPDYKDWHSGSIDNSPGQTIRMDRRFIDDNPNSHCSKGLHVGALSYAQSFHGGTKMVLIKVDPANIVCVPNDYSCQKCRVCEYTVLRDVEGVLNQPLYTSEGEPYNPNFGEDINWDDFSDEYDDQYDEGEVLSYNDDYDDEDDYDYEEDDDDSDLPPFIEL